MPRQVDLHTCCRGSFDTLHMQQCPPHRGIPTRESQTAPSLDIKNFPSQQYLENLVLLKAQHHDQHILLTTWVNSHTLPHYVRIVIYLHLTQGCMHNAKALTSPLMGARRLISLYQ